MKKGTIKSTLLIVSMALFFTSTPVQADLSFFHNRTLWENAVSGTIVTEDFNSVTPYYMTEGVNHAGLIDIELIGLSSVSQWNSINNGSGPLNINGSRYYQGGSNYSGANSINLLMPTTAFGGDFISTHSAGGLTLRVGSLQYEFSSLLPNGAGSGFLGFVSTDPFSQITLFDASKNETFGLDNVSFVTAVPAPGAAILGFIGLGTVGWVKRRLA